MIGIIAFGFIFSHISESLATEGQKTNIKLHQFYDHRFNGGQPIVFVGNLFSESGHRIPNAQILIKNDAPCPVDGVIAKGFTDKNGRFWINTIAMVAGGTRVVLVCCGVLVGAVIGAVVASAAAAQ